MQRAGTEVLAHWREAGQWWEYEAYREVRRVVDARGVAKEVIRDGPSLGIVTETGQKAEKTEHNEEWSLRERKIRDEKVSAACNKLPKSYYERKELEKKMAAETAWAVAVREPGATYATKAQTGYAALHTFSGYAFGQSTMLTEEIASLAALGGCSAVALVDPFALTGVSELAKACERNGIKAIVGTSIELAGGGSLVLLAQSKEGYQSLSRLISECHLSEPRGYPLGTWERLERHSAGLICLTGGDTGPLDPLLIRRDRVAAEALIQRLKRMYATVVLEVERSFLPWQKSVEDQLVQLGEAFGLMLVAGGVTTHARRSHYIAQDVLVCAHTLATIDEIIGRKPQRDPSQPAIQPRPLRALNAERFLKTDKEMCELFSDKPEWVENTRRIADLCESNVLPSRSTLSPLFENDAHALEQIVGAQASLCYRKITTPIRKRLKMEVDRINNLGFSTHFLVAWDMVRWATEQGVQLSGRGSVVDSAVAFVLGFSRVDAVRHGLHFDRFLPPDGNKRPDIDIDFEARRREDIRGYLTRKYGVEHTATVSAIGAYGTKGIVREVSKVFGIPEETVSFLSKKIHGSVSADELEAALSKRPELRDNKVPVERFQWVLRLSKRLMDVPRNMRCHSSGVVISSQPIRDTVPVMHSATVPSGEAGTEENGIRLMQWDKRSAKHYFDKFDILCLRGQDVLSRIEDQIRVSNPDASVQRIAVDDPETYRAMRSGELIGIPQSASPAMRQAHIRLKTKNLTDASLVQAGIRPGVGGAVKINGLIARRRGKPYQFEHPELERILGHTYGIIVFQEQVDQLLQTFAGYSGGQAEDIRDAIHKYRREESGKGIGDWIRETVIGKILERGFSLTVAEQVFDYVTGFKGYGFAQGHALAFAEISVRCIHLMQHHPAEYFAALLSSQPAGYYGPTTLANEARNRGVAMLHPDVNASANGFSVEEQVVGGLRVPGGAIRTGLMQVSGLSKETKARMLAESSIESIESIVSPTGLRPTPPPGEYLVEVPSVGSPPGNDVKFPSSGGVPFRAGWFSSHEPTEGVPFAENPTTEFSPTGLRPTPPPGEYLRTRFKSLFDFVTKTSPHRDELEALILSGAFDSLHPCRKALLWAIPDAFDHAAVVNGMKGGLPFEVPEPDLLQMDDFTEDEKAVYERAILGMDVDRHLMKFERENISSKGGLTTLEAKQLRPGQKAIVVGNPIRLRFPPTPSGKRVVFFDLEDEWGLLNVTCFDRVYQLDGKAIVTSGYVTLVGEAQDRDGHTAFLAQRVYPYQPQLMRGENMKVPVVSGDFLVG